MKGVCASDAQPWRCAATRFDKDVMLPQTAESSTPHCIGCDSGKTILYDHCKSHSYYVNSSLLATAAAAVPPCPGAGARTRTQASTSSDGDTTNAPDSFQQCSNLSSFVEATSLSSTARRRGILSRRKDNTNSYRYYGCYGCYSNICSIRSIRSIRNFMCHP